MRHPAERPTIKLPVPKKDLSGYLGVAMDIKNLCSYGIFVEAQCKSEKPGPGSYGHLKPNKSLLWLEPGDSDILYITFYRDINSLPSYISSGFKGIHGLPGGFLKHWEILDLESMNEIEIYVSKPLNECIFTVDNIRVVGDYQLPDEELMKTGLFPFVDKFGQYIHSDWPGKTKTPEDILIQRDEEFKDLGENPAPGDWNVYGGWNNGPQLKATGHFRVEKYQGKWWLVDPEGRLFWSQGIDCVTLSQNTPVTGRENFFKDVPDKGDFLIANLLIKYGNIWSVSPKDTATSVMHKRLRSWGINTIANWSDSYIYLQKKTPYTATLSSGMPKKMLSKIDEKEFRASCASRLARGNIKSTAYDPWCIGYFVDNEFQWPDSNAAEVIDTYYRIVKEELEKLAPNKLYMGSRIHDNNPAALAAAAKYCDVVSINRYEYTVSDFTMPGKEDKPVIIGEFHFGALDRGLFHTGLRSVLNQKQRADTYSNYINQAIDHHLVVGAHWFQFSDQVCSGRNDGENYQIGFVDICDRPYPEMITVARKIGASLYTRRSMGTLVSVLKK
jgi:hypothetical protein